MPIAKIGQRGQMTIPRKVREWMNLSEGDRVFLVRNGNQIRMHPAKRTLLDLRGAIKVPGPQDFTEIRRQVLAARAKKRGQIP
ncbi:MAG: AbrB/MazE/SpoVT family DNA-binding domain-containing protein [Chloroflexi bacterium]|nr:AbrB/MazE/SpoVT family DNA-binding domain-containing protein [Chloroflexota bacterium]